MAAEAAEFEQLLEMRRELEVSLDKLAVSVSSREVAPLEKLQRALPADAALVAAFGAVIAFPGLRHFYDLKLPPLLLSLAAVGIIAMAVAVLESGWRVVAWVRAHRARVWPPSVLARAALDRLRERPAA